MNENASAGNTQHRTYNECRAPRSLKSPAGRVVSPFDSRFLIQKRGTVHGNGPVYSHRQQQQSVPILSKDACYALQVRSLYQIHAPFPTYNEYMAPRSLKSPAGRVVSPFDSRFLIQKRGTVHGNGPVYSHRQQQQSVPILSKDACYALQVRSLYQIHAPFPKLLPFAEY